MRTCTYISCTLAFVTRFTAEVLPRHLKELIEEGAQEWEESLCKVNRGNVSVELSLQLSGIRSRQYSLLPRFES